MMIIGPAACTVSPLHKEDPALLSLQESASAAAETAAETLAQGGTGWALWAEQVCVGILTLLHREITVIYVSPAWRGRGAALVLLEQAADRPMEICLSLQQEDLQRTVTRFGFEYTGECSTGKTDLLVLYRYEPAPVPAVRLDVPWIDQMERWPTGCESVSAVMALQYAGVPITVDNWIDHHLPMGKAPQTECGIYTGADPWQAFPGDPRTPEGWGCFVPVIEKAAGTALAGTGYRLKALYGLSVETLCRLYTARGIPVIFWATLDMAQGRPCRSWQKDNGTGEYTWTEPMHCLLMTGFDTEYVYFNDPMRAKDTAYPWEAVRQAYRTMHRQAAVVLPEQKAMEYAHSAGAVLYTVRDGGIHYLLVREKLGHTGFPKGHLETRETVYDAALREIREETGLCAELRTDFREETLYLLCGGNKWKHVTYFAARYQGNAHPAHTGEVADCFELPYESAMEALTYQNTRELLKKADAWIRKGL